MSHFKPDQSLQNKDIKASGYSGMQGFIEVPAVKEISAYAEQAREADHFDPISILPFDARKLGMLLEDESKAKIEFEKSSSKRDRFCLELEKKYNLTGKVWSVDFKSGVFKIEGDR